MKIDLTGKRAVIAGGSRGIGRAIALAFAGAGAGVSICARGAEALAATRDDIGRQRGKAHAAALGEARPGCQFDSRASGTWQGGRPGGSPPT